ncbi:MAG TPA: Holliday junction resolvase-like protein [Methanolinea sp.]|nr:Holliday junction resolvase-like protein [Methanolinea sp.]
MVEITVMVLAFALVTAILALLILLLAYFRAREKIDERAHTLFEEWRSVSLEREARERAELLCREWVAAQETRIRRDAVERSEAVVRGRVTEHLIPFFPSFPYNPRDARFLGSPVDFVVFSGLSAGSLDEIVFVEVKSGKSASLSSRERMVRACVEEGKVRYHIMKTGGA